MGLELERAAFGRQVAGVRDGQGDEVEAVAGEGRRQVEALHVEGRVAEIAARGARDARVALERDLAAEVRRGHLVLQRAVVLPARPLQVDVFVRERGAFPVRVAGDMVDQRAAVDERVAVGRAERPARQHVVVALADGDRPRVAGHFVAGLDRARARLDEPARAELRHVLRRQGDVFVRGRVQRRDAGLGIGFDRQRPRTARETGSGGQNGGEFAMSNVKHRCSFPPSSSQRNTRCVAWSGKYFLVIGW